MHDPISRLQPNVSQIVADALRLAADGMGRWLDRPVDAKQISTRSIDVESAHHALTSRERVLCCCAMPVGFAYREIGSVGQTAELPSTHQIPAGRLLMAWTCDQAARLVDQSLHSDGTSSDQSTWHNLQWSVIAETANVIGCEFLNAVAEKIGLLSSTEISLIPSPPHVSQQPAGILLNDTVLEIGSTEAASDDLKVWLATGRFQVADHSLETRFTMAWTPTVWLRLTELVQRSIDNRGGL